MKSNGLLGLLIIGGLLAFAMGKFGTSQKTGAMPFSDAEAASSPSTLSKGQTSLVGQLNSLGYPIQEGGTSSSSIVSGESVYPGFDAAGNYVGFAPGTQQVYGVPYNGEGINSLGYPILEGGTPSSSAVSGVPVAPGFDAEGNYTGIF